ncbi:MULTISPECIES: hypothetical protein [Streptomyces]|uniref:hypothetical protein n=1 Tax=Streptomyces lycopersici TaxID=2974589 RepID=UPI0021CE2592|nr:hypothetical protein [Streptomyces sp. NEAU-383]
MIGIVTIRRYRALQRELARERLANRRLHRQLARAEGTVEVLSKLATDQRAHRRS